MNLRCTGCGASLRVNPNLLGTTLTCPKCGTTFPTEEGSRPPPRKEKPFRRPRPPFTLWLILGQALLFLLGASCLAGALFRDAWKPPAWSYFQENRLVLAAAGVGFVVLSGVARLLPVLMTLVASLAVMWACALHYTATGEVDASRALALSAALFSVWLALQHRRALAPQG